MSSPLYIRPAGTSWGAVLGGWIAVVGAAALLAPAVAALLTGARVGPNELGPAVPVILGLFIAYLIGGYVAGRMAGYRTSWHGMMTAFFSLFLILVAMLLGYAADRGVFASAGLRDLAQVVPGVRDLNINDVGDALTFAALLGFLATIFAGWLGGLLAPSIAVAPVTTAAAPPVVPAPVVRSERREVVRERRFLPTLGRKGGERVEEKREETRVDRG